LNGRWTVGIAELERRLEYWEAEVEKRREDRLRPALKEAERKLRDFEERLRAIRGSSRRNR
jgi:hypothetical protein